MRSWRTTKAVRTSQIPGFLKKFRRTAWPFQQTFLTPLKQVDEFVATILTVGKVESSCLTLDNIVFEPRNTGSLLFRYEITDSLKSGISIDASTRDECRVLLQAALSDPVDFAFVPIPKTFALFADHDQFTTFFAHRRSGLSHIVKALTDRDFKAIPDYIRRF